MNLTPWERYFSFLLSGVLSVQSTHRKSGQQCVLQRLLCTILGDGRSQEHFSFSWVFVCTGFLWYLLGDTLPSITRPRDLPQDSLFLYHRVFKVILRPLPIVTCSLKNIPPQRVCDVYNRENGGYVHTEGSSSHGIFNPKARGKYHNSPRTMCPSTSSKAFREIPVKHHWFTAPYTWTVESPISSCWVLNDNTCDYSKQEYLLLLRVCVMVW